MHGIVRRCSKLLAQKKSSMHISLPFGTSRLSWNDRRLETLLCRLAHKASLEVNPGKTIRIAVRPRTKMRGLEKFFQICPSHWIQLRIAWCGPDGFDMDARELITGLGYRCEEWIGASGSWPQLGAFSFGARRLVKFLFWVRREKNLQQCDLLIPIMEPEQP
jgi:hypothetical protein